MIIILSDFFMCCQNVKNKYRRLQRANKTVKVI